MNKLAAGILKKDRAEVLIWLRARLRNSERALREAVKDKDYALAQLIQGHVEAYAFAILHLEGRIRR